MATITDIIGHTPLVELTNINPNPKVKLYAKLEGNNPAGSVKDRPAYYMLKNAIARGDIKKGTKVIEATSGNTGIALSMIARLLHVDMELVMPETATAERVKTMRAYGSKVTLLDDMETCRDYAEAQGEKDGYWVVNQFANDDNWLSHYETTGPEIWEDTGHGITHFVSAMGTTGTIMGTSKYLKEQNEDVQVIGCQPKEGSRIPGIRRWPEKYLPKIFDSSRVDRTIDLSMEDARNTARKLAKEEGILAGMSSGGAAFAALKMAEELDSGVIVFIVCDRGDRYLSSDLFE